MARKRHRWKAGDVFLIPTIDGALSIGQVIGREPDMLRSATCAFFDRTVKADALPLKDPGELPLREVYSILFVTTHYLDDGRWPIVGSMPVRVPQDFFPYEHLRRAGFVGATVNGAKIVQGFANAFRGLSPWDAWKDPAYLDKLLIHPEKETEDPHIEKDNSMTKLLYDDQFAPITTHLGFLAAISI